MEMKICNSQLYIQILNAETSKHSSLDALRWRLSKIFGVALRITTSPKAQ
jgi:hypothetical protein